MHGEKEWAELVAKMQTALDKKEANYDKPSQKKLLAIFKDDQNIRHQYIQTVTNMVMTILRWIV